MENEGSIKIISTNRKASFNYFLDDFLECGISLLGSEIKSIRIHGVTMTDAYIVFKNNEAYLINMHISPYEKASAFTHDPLRSRKLLMHKRQILRYKQDVEIKKLILVPTKIYFKKGKVKVEIALGKPKKLYDKRESIKEKDVKRNIDKNLKRNK